MFLLRLPGMPGMPDRGSGMAGWTGCGGGAAVTGAAAATRGPVLPGGGLDNWLRLIRSSKKDKSFSGKFPIILYNFSPV